MIAYENACLGMAQTMLSSLVTCIGHKALVSSKSPATGGAKVCKTGCCTRSVKGVSL